MPAGDDFLGKTGACASYDDNAFPFLAVHRPKSFPRPVDCACASPGTVAVGTDALNFSERPERTIGKRLMHVELILVSRPSALPWPALSENGRIDLSL